MVSFMPQMLYHREDTPGTHWIGVWVGPRDNLDKMVKRKYALIAPSRNCTPVIQPIDRLVTILTELPCLRNFDVYVLIIYKVFYSLDM
jgi:hypothetical protein